MEELEWDNPAEEERWCGECRRKVTEYLGKEGVEHGDVGRWPAWHVAPYLSLWAIRSLRAPGQVGWWVICGDLPTDYLSAATAREPQQAMLAFADTWREVAASMRKGLLHPGLRIEPPEQSVQLASLLANRSEALRTFAEDESFWST